MATESRELQLVLSLKDNLSGGLKSAVGTLEKMEPQFKQIAAVGAVSFAALAVAIGSCVKEANEAEASQFRLEHLLRTASGATQEQINLLNEQADALSRVGVVSDDNIRVVQSQLATFNMSADAIKALTPSILDYVVAEKGASASSDEFKQATNGLAQALNGNYASLTKTGFVLDETTKYTIENGTEAQRTAAIIKVLDSTYKGFNAGSLTTAEGKLIKATNEMNRFREAVGNGVNPALGAMGKAIAPVISKLADWAERNPNLVAGIAAAALALTGLVAVLGTLAVVLPVVAAGAAALGVALLPILGIAAAVSAVIGVATYAFASHQNAASSAAKAQTEAARTAEDAKNALAGAVPATRQMTEAQKELAKATEESTKKIEGLLKQAKEVIEAAAQDELNAKKNLAEELIAQEQKVADMRRDLVEAQRNVTDAESYRRAQDLAINLAKEQTALTDAGYIRTQYATEVAEAERRASLTAFQRRIEDIQAERAANAAKHTKRLLEIYEEVAAEQKKNDDIVASYKAAQEAMRVETVKTTGVIQAEASKQQQALMSVGSRGGGSFANSTPATSFGNAPIGFRADGGPVNAGSPYIVGERGPEMFVPRQSGTIIPNGVGGVSVNVVVNGDVTGRELVDRVQEAIMSSIRMNTKISV